MKITTQQTESDLNAKRRALRRRISRRNRWPQRNGELREDTVTFTGRCQKILAFFKGLKEIVTTLTWLKALIISLFGMSIIFCSSSYKAILSEVFPQAANGGKQFDWSHPDKSVKADFDGRCTKPSLMNLFGFLGDFGLQLQYGATHDVFDGGWGVHWDDAPNKGFDASGFDHFRFWVRGASGEEWFEIGLKDTSAHETKIESKDWIATNHLRNGVEVIIPLTEFKSVNKQSLNNISFSINSLHGSGNICIDEIAFGAKSDRA